MGNSKQLTRPPIARFALVLMLWTGVMVAPLLSQNQRNPVLEFSTGTWCQWCPCGDQVALEEVLRNYPNTIVLAYHGPANYASEPFSRFAGNTVISSLGFNAYPTGIIDRVTGIISRSIWQSWTANRAAIAPTVNIEKVYSSYNPGTREYIATFDFTALQNLSGEFRFNALLVEDGIVYGQTSNNTCTPGQTYLPNYVHDWLVRDMMNGALGEVINSGAWNANQTIRKTLRYTVPIPPAPAPDIVPDSCRVVVKVYKNGAPLNSNAEIQQAEQWPFISEAYVAATSIDHDELIYPASTPVYYQVRLKNMGALADSYMVSLRSASPQGWAHSFHTPHGRFEAGQTDVLSVNPGDSVRITIEMNANGIVGSGKALLDYTSPHFVAGTAEVRLVTFGMKTLVVDDESDGHESYMKASLERTSEVYGVVRSKTVLPFATQLHNFESILWMCAATLPTLDSTEQKTLSNFLDSGGRLYLSGVDIAYELADPSSPHYTAKSLAFFTKYLHAAYIKRDYNSVAVSGIANDPISHGMLAIGIASGNGARTINPSAGRFANQIAPADANAASVFSYYQWPNDYPAIRALHTNGNVLGRVVFMTFGFETLNRDVERDTLLARVLSWLRSPTAVAESPADAPNTFALHPNYPNPFSRNIEAATRLSYTLPSSEQNRHVSLVILNQLGQQVKVLVNQTQAPGRHEAGWDGRDEQGRLLSSGVYFSRLKYGRHQAMSKIVVLR